MRILIYGAGSLGTVLGAYLSKPQETKESLEVQLVTRNRAHIETLQKNGAQITGTVQMTVPVDCMLPEEITGVYDMIFLLTKQLENHAVAEFLKPFLKTNGVLCTFQNGIPEPGLMKILGEDRVVGSTVAWGATLVSPGVCEVTSSPDSFSFSLGCLSEKAKDKLPAVAACLERMCPVELEENFIGARWSKLLINAAFSGMGTVLGTTFGGCAKPKASRIYVQAIIKEAIDVAKKAGIKIAPVQGKDIAKLLDYSNAVKKKMAFLIIPIAIKKHNLIKPSMLQDIEKGKPCEVDAINGVLCEYGRQYGVPTPVCDKVVEILRGVETGKYRCEWDNLKLF